MIFWYLWIYGFSLLIILIEKLFSIYKRKQFYIILLSFLDILILKIQLGESFRAGVIYATNRFEGYVRGQLEHLLQYIILMHQPSRASYPKYILDFIKELQFAEKSPHRALETLKHYQESLKFTNNLKKKYMDVTYQVYAQTIIMALLFISLLLYTIFNYHFFEHLILILSSVALFFTGILLVLIYGKKWKWKF
ncbi:MAG: hypothetical protein HAW63_01430 [Bdellovibrionaceae bacterium]|nr:hypothetical protein [Pseudobdellovibrionaceae bacterium]